MPLAASCNKLSSVPRSRRFSLHNINSRRSDSLMQWEAASRPYRSQAQIRQKPLQRKVGARADRLEPIILPFNPCTVVMFGCAMSL